jgi:nucleoid-associated protein YgaU
MKGLITGNSCAKGCAVYLIMLALILAVSGPGSGAIRLRIETGSPAQSGQSTPPVSATARPIEQFPVRPEPMRQQPPATPTPAAAAQLGGLQPAVTATPYAQEQGISAEVSGPFYIVQPGDTLWSIARQFGTTVEALRRANGLDGNLIWPGQVLYLPEDIRN